MEKFNKVRIENPAEYYLKTCRDSTGETREQQQDFLENGFKRPSGYGVTPFEDCMEDYFINQIEQREADGEAPVYEYVSPTQVYIFLCEDAFNYCLKVEKSLRKNLIQKQHFTNICKGFSPGGFPGGNFS